MRRVIQVVVVVAVAAVLCFVVVLVVLFSQVACTPEPPGMVKARTELVGIRRASQFFRNDIGRWPTSLAELFTATTPDGGVHYIEGDFVDPWTSSPYVLVRQDKALVVMSYGADGQPGGAGINADLVEEIGLVDD